MAVTVGGASGGGAAGSGGGPGSVPGNNGAAIVDDEFVTIAGGSGGSPNGNAGASDFGGMGGGGGGQGGANGLTLNGGTNLISQTVTGGNGGAGGRGDENGGGGGAGGYGIFFQQSGSITITSTGHVEGGDGGAGGAGKFGGGQAGVGGGGILVTGNGNSAVTITNDGFIGAGNGSSGGDGIRGANLVVINSGQISGGFGGPAGDAIVFETGANTYEHQQGGSNTGNVVGDGNDAFRLGGSANDMFSVSDIGASSQYRGFSSFSSTGTATWTLTGSNTSITSWTASSGTLIVNATMGNTAFTVGNGATLGGSGALGDVTVQSGGTYSPGNSAVKQSMKNFDLSSGTLEIELGGLVVGTEYDQVDATGSVKLGGTLNLTLLSFVPSLGNSFTIINNDLSDAVINTFAGLDEGATFTIGDKLFKITYQGGTNNNDVVVSVVSPAPTLVKNLGSSVNEGGTIVIPSLRLGYTDTDQEDGNLVYTITSETAGEILNDTTVLGVGDTFTQTDINGGQISFRHDGSETTAAGFGFSLSDGQGNTISGQSFAITVTPVNDAPTVANAIPPQSTLEDAPFTFVVPPNSFTDGDVGDTLTYSATLADGSALPSWLTFTAATLTFSGTPTNGNVGTISVKVTATDNSNASVSQAFSLNVQNVNDAPSGQNKTITTNEDTAYTFKVADFAFADDDNDALASVKITSLPTNGTLKLNGAAVAANQVIAAADVKKLVFTSAANANGAAAFASFTFIVQDNGGTANGGLDTDASANTISFNVAAVNDAPTAVVASNVRGPIAENASTAAAIKFADLDITDVDGGNNVLSLAGADASLFQILNGDLYLKAGAKLDFETNPKLDVTVIVNDASVGGAIDAQKALSFSVTDIIESYIGNGSANTFAGTASDETFIGGEGADKMTGGGGRDTFVFKALTDTAAGSPSFITNPTIAWQSGLGQRDVITDFTPGNDKIDLSLIDASTKLAGNQAFAFNGTGTFSSNPGSLIYRVFDLAGTANDRTIVYADVNGDRLADMQIELTGLKTLQATDFVL